MYALNENACPMNFEINNDRSKQIHPVDKSDKQTNSIYKNLPNTFQCIDNGDDDDIALRRAKVISSCWFN